MQILYDLLGARPDDDAEGLENAFRKAAGASRADFRAGNPDAPKHFRQIVEAYDILRDTERRAAYDRLLESERGQLRSILKRAVSYFAHNIVSDAVGVIGLIIVLAGGHTLFAYMSKTSVDTADVAVPGPAEKAGIQPAAGAGATEPDAPDDRRLAALDTPKAASSAEALSPDGGGPASSPAAPGVEVARTGAKSDDKHDMKAPETPNIIMGRHEAEPKRQAKIRTPVRQAPVKQASLENRKPSTCSRPQACPRDEPPLFGIGY
jgi:curved DNA-binding protein CbpA